MGVFAGHRSLQAKNKSLVMSCGATKARGGVEGAARAGTLDPISPQPHSLLASRGGGHRAAAVLLADTGFLLCHMPRAGGHEGSLSLPTLPRPSGRGGGILKPALLMLLWSAVTCCGFYVKGEAHFAVPTLSLCHF